MKDDCRTSFQKFYLSKQIITSSMIKFAGKFVLVGKHNFELRFLFQSDYLAPIHNTSITGLILAAKGMNVLQCKSSCFSA